MLAHYNSVCVFALPVTRFCELYFQPSTVESMQLMQEGNPPSKSLKVSKTRWGSRSKPNYYGWRQTTTTKISKFLCGHRKGHSPFFTPVGSMYMHFVVIRAHTLLGPFLVMLISCTAAQSNFYQDCVHACMAFNCYYSTHTLLGPVCCTTRLYLHVLVSVLLQYIYT